MFSPDSGGYYMKRADKAVGNSDQPKKTTFISDLKSLFKFTVLIANVLPVISGFWLALYFTDHAFTDYWIIFLLTMIGSTLVMAGALVLNNWYDVDIDMIMQRTKNRPTVTGNIPMNTVLTIGIVASILGLIILLFTTLEATIYAFIGWFLYVVPYTMWTKRKYTFNTMIGSLSGAVTPLIGWAAVDSAFHIVPIVLFLILFLWQMPHTFAIAIRKYDEYKAAGVAMMPVVYGFEATKRQMLVYIACLVPLPFYLAQLGTTFIVIATLLNLGWLAIAISGFFVKDIVKWARWNFLYSVNYLLLIFLMVIAFTLPMFQS
jgi:protoheme IX farnesyltransferase